MQEFTAIILAAGRGTRMNSALPKVLHPVAGIPMIARVIQAVRQAGAKEVRVVVGYAEQLVRQVVEPLGVQCFKQENQLGTADAVRAAKHQDLSGTVLILNGDQPLVTSNYIHSVLEDFKESRSAFGVVTAEFDWPGDLGRIFRHKGELKAIVEAKDASAETLQIKEINTAMYCIRSDLLIRNLPKVKNENAKNEYYFTDMVSICLEAGEKVVSIQGKQEMALGVNSQKELAEATEVCFLRKADELMNEGVIIMSPSNTYIEDSVQVGPSSVIYPNVFLRGHTKVGKFCVLESNSFVSDSTLEDSVQIKANSYIEKSIIRTKASVGPFARLRPETDIGMEAHVGNFVEMKKVKFGEKSKAGHLTYLGDAEIGKDVNIGCGTITCNYAVDKKKYRTVIGNGVFVGSDTQFVAPVTIGENAVIGSGSTITKDVPAQALAVARGKQITKENYVVKAAVSEDKTEGKKSE